MKIFCFVLAMIFILCGCSFTEQERPVFSEIPDVPLIPHIEPGTGYQSVPEKIFLPLINFREKGLELPDSAVISGTRVEIPLVLPENSAENNSSIVPVILWPELIDEIQKDFPDFDPENPGWNAFINFFTADGTGGMLKIEYYIDDNIITDKAIIGTIENGVIVRLNYTNMIFETDEEIIREKAEKFLDSTTQTKKIFEEGEEFLSEDTMFHYYYPLDTLVYSYQLFFYYGPEDMKVINNDYGYECIVE